MMPSDIDVLEYVVSLCVFCFLYYYITITTLSIIIIITIIIIIIIIQHLYSAMESKDADALYK